MGDRYDSLPEPNALQCTALIEYRCGPETYESLCPAASIRTVEWDETHEQVTWLHCIAAEMRRRKRNAPISTMKLLIPVQYITNIQASPKFTIKAGKCAQDVAVFPPEHPSPSNQMPLMEIQKVLTNLQIPVPE